MQRNGSPQYFLYYETSLQCASLDVLHVAEIRIYCLHKESPLKDYTVVNLIGRLFAPSDRKYLIDGLFMTPFPGDLADDEYESTILDDMNVKIWAVGSVLNKAKQWKDGSSRLFNLAVCEYVWDSTKHFQISSVHLILRSVLG
ncbi:hypothetical protein K439DRAFT_1332094 [Ramaria rubella]|nr:hypothetical protein K439DRAFT_1332094 [Ramaria rubella]